MKKSKILKITSITILIFFIKIIISIPINAFEIIGHRGASALAPENTLNAIEKAWVIGADGVEIDINLTKDNKIVLMHDNTLTRVSNGKVNSHINDINWNDLNSIDVGSFKSLQFKGVTPPLLLEVLEQLPAAKKIFIEIKDNEFPKNEQIVLNQLKNDFTKLNNNLVANIFIISFNIELINKAKAKFPQYSFLYNISSKNFYDLDFIIKKAKKNNIDGLNLQFDSKLPAKDYLKAFDLMNYNKLLISIWTSKFDDNDETLKFIKKQKVNFFMTNFPSFYRK